MRRAGEGGGVKSRPHCINCRRPMYMRRPNPQRKGGTTGRFFCAPCGVSSGVHTTGPHPLADCATRPWCVRCRSMMRSQGTDHFCCKTCRASVTAHTSGFRCRRDIDERPTCGACARPKGLSTRRRGRGYFSCNFCRIARRRLRECPEAADALLTRTAAALPAYLSPEEREDAAQSIYLDILTGKLPPVAPTAHTLRRYATHARSMTNDRYRFISLSAPTPDGREFGDTLAA